METNHLKNNRNYRVNFIKNNIGFGKEVDSFFWDRGHPDGPEVHHISSTGIITIENALSHRIITYLIARPGQIKRYYEKCGKHAPNYLIKVAQSHMTNAYNLI